MQWEIDVIIVGAGAAGLSAAKELSRSGHSYTVVEGAHRIGGRAYSEEIATDVWFDLGCAWLVGGFSNPFVAIADKLGITLDKDNSELFKEENHRFQRNSVSLKYDQHAACLRYYNDSYKAIATVVEQGQDVAISDVLSVDNEFAAPLLANIASGWGTDIDLISTADYCSTIGELGFQAPQGYGNLIATWGADVPVSLNTRVERINWSGHGVRVETSKGNLTGRTVLNTVSTGILGSGDIRFVPDLPTWKKEAIHNLPMGTENKMGIHFDTDVFGADGRGHYSVWNDDGNSAKVDVSVMGFNTAVVFIGGRHGVWLEKQGQQACHDFAVNRIVDIFGHDIRKYVNRSITTAWHSEPWTRGSWAYAQPGQAHQRTNLACTVDERLFFAGEATVIGEQGTCHGAYLSGIRAAQEIAAKLCRE